MPGETTTCTSTKRMVTSSKSPPTRPATAPTATPTLPAINTASGPSNVVAGSHVMMTVPNFYRVETNLYDLSSYNKFIEEPLDNRGGELRLSPRPGLGITMNIDFLRANVVDGIGRS